MIDLLVGALGVFLIASVARIVVLLLRAGARLDLYARTLAWLSVGVLSGTIVVLALSLLAPS